MNSQNTAYLQFLISIMLLTIFSCCKNGNSSKSIQIVNKYSYEGNNDKYEKLYNLTKKEFNKEISDYKHIFFFNNKGCKPCNEHFFQHLTKHVFTSDVLIIYSGGKHSFNYNKINPLCENQIIDEYEIYRDLGYLNVSSILQLSDNGIDTIYKVDATFKEYEEIIIKKAIMQHQ